MLPLVVFRPKGFILAVGVVSNNGVGKLQNMLGRTVVALQLKHLCIFEILFKVQNVFNLRPSPAVNGLVVIANGKQIAVDGRKIADNFILYRVGILELVHQNVAETSAEIISCIGVGFQKISRCVEKVIKVQGVVFVQVLLIALVHLDDFVNFPLPCVFFGVLVRL